MNLHKKTLRALAEMICGAAGSGPSGFVRMNFPYRTSAALTQFFEDCGLEFRHDGSTRVLWVLDALADLNKRVASSRQLPSDSMITVISELLDGANFAAPEVRLDALTELNHALGRDGLTAYFDDEGTVQVRRSVTGASSGALRRTIRRSWTEAEREKMRSLENFLDSASEDEIILEFLLPLLNLLGFHRLSVKGHEDKALEYGNDLWMKLQLPTEHWIYFAAQVKKGTIDAAGKSKEGRSNISEILNQVRMLLDHPVFDPDFNRKVLVDHVYVISGGAITKQARNWLVEHLDAAMRRHLIFMDREELLSLAIGCAMPMPGPALNDQTPGGRGDAVPF